MPMSSSVCRIDVVIMPEHGHGEALAESARADEEEELVGVLHLLDEPCLIDVIAVILPYGNEIHHPVGYAFHLSFSTVSFHFQVSLLVYDSKSNIFARHYKIIVIHIRFVFIRLQS